MTQRLALASAGLWLALAGFAVAHTGHGAATPGGFLSGLTHPILGPDHVVAMLAVGLWGACLGRPAVWLLPVVFPVVMALAAAAGMAGVPLPAVEPGIAVSALALGLLVALAARPPLWAAAVVVGAFAVFHGHAHGAELPAAVSPVAYGAGFLLATTLLHCAGIALGLLASRPRGALVVRGGGGLISLAGAGFLLGAL